MAGLVIALVLLAAAACLSLMVGAKRLSIDTVLQALLSSSDTYEHRVILDSRLPRTLLALAVGPAFGLSGALIQALTRNPLADPGILGVSAGAAFAVAIGVGFFSIGTVSGSVGFALVGAFAATVIVYVIGGGGGRSSPTPVQLTLAGVAIGAALSGFTTAMTILDSKAFERMLNWTVGTLARTSLTDVAPVLPILLVGALLALAISPALNAIAFGEDRAASLGVNVLLVRGIGLVAVTLLAGGATAIAGPIGFLGLMVPHCIRWFVGPSQPWIFVYSLVVAPLLLLVADMIGRTVLSPAEVPVGIIMGFIGGPILILLVRRRSAGARS
ncbi:iron chelate uptake ABC transporter family permease subunit [Paenibacillus albicereus]|uniref:Iron chelate uptake ABC transporter family permease subunit n=1 Tax=Paenibacillus albicereus TaxID=2726185 RepID=A0A6H2GZ52_9BACL|nr:iron chelate uptake ABC transporter family permease subunit [Paenibacillus albicereus]QJC52714.1 iron chelate uptake ABC transporter family permease subunit [Paenibacillus albicereus]